MKKYFIVGALTASMIVPLLTGATSVADLQAQIATLMAQIQQLQAQLQAQQGGGTTWCHTFISSLTIGSSGAEVVALQTALSKEGFQVSNASGRFDEVTASAVVGFQEKYREEILTPNNLQHGTGYVGPATRKKLNKLYGCNGISASPIPYPTPISPLRVISPNDGEVWQAGSTQTIKWSGGGPDWKVWVGIRKLPTTQDLQAASPLANTGSYTFTVSPKIETGEYYIYLVCQTCSMGTDGAGDWSDSSFTIINNSVATTTQSSVTLFNPNGGETLTEGQNYSIRWSTPNTGRQVRLSLYPWGRPDVAGIIVNNEVKPSDIGISAVGASSFVWTVPSVISDMWQQLGISRPTGYGIRAIISDSNGQFSLGSARDYSDGPFNIVSPFTQVTPSPTPTPSFIIIPTPTPTPTPTPAYILTPTPTPPLGITTEQDGQGYLVKPVYFVASDLTPAPDYETKLQSMWTLVKQFYDTEMQRQGFTDRSMNLSIDSSGKPKIYFIRGKQNAAYYKGNFMNMQHELETIFDKDKSLVAVYSEGFSPWTGGRFNETNLRGGYSYFGGFLRYLGTTTEETKKNMCDQNYPNPSDAGGGGMKIAGILSNRFGGAMHETGHAFGVQHQLVDKLDIVAWGYFGASNWFYGTRDGQSGPCLWNGAPDIARGTALLLNISPFFRQNTSYTDNTAPTISVIAPSTINLGDPIPLDITVSDAGSGLGLLLINIPGATVHFEDLRNRGNTVRFTYTIPMTSDILPNLKAGPSSLGFELYDNDANRTILYKPFTITAVNLPPPNKAPVGTVDTISSTRVNGWAYDADSSTTPIDVSVYFDTIKKTFTASVNRPDLGNGFLPTTNHGFDFNPGTLGIPAGIYSVSVKAVDPQTGQEVELTGSPKTITLPAGTVLGAATAADLQSFSNTLASLRAILLNMLESIK